VFQTNGFEIAYLYFLHAHKHNQTDKSELIYTGMVFKNAPKIVKNKAKDEILWGWVTRVNLL